MATNTRSMIIKGLILGEVVFLVGSYRVWHQMNTNQEYRLWMHKHYPSVLSGFYKSAEVMGIHGTKEMDYQTWGVDS